jgi:hypothetical protein
VARAITALNGRLPAATLAPIGGGFYLRRDAAAAYLAARAAGCPAGVNSAYRTYDEQSKLYAKYLAGGPLAEKPGKSWHGEGLALDIPSKSGAQQWLLAHPAYGFRRTIMPAEPWHFEFFPDLYTAGDDVDVQTLKNAIADAFMTSKQIADAVRRIVWIDTKVQRGSGAVSALQELADAKTAAQRADAKADAILATVKQIPGVDPAALAARVAEAVARVPAETDVAAIAAAVNDEADRRARERLG